MLRLGAVSPALRVADVDFNVARLVEAIAQAGAEQVQVLVFPELAITGYTIGDLVQQQALLLRVRDGLAHLLTASADSRMIVVAGAPLEFGGRIYNCAVVLFAGKILGVVPKTFIPNYKEFYEKRWFSSSREADCDSVELLGSTVPFGTDILFSLGEAKLGVEVCEDLWYPVSPHEHQALAGANVLVNLSASNELLGKAEWRRTIVAAASGRCLAAYCYVSSGIDESANDIVYGGHIIIAENGNILQESGRLLKPPVMSVADIDIANLNHDRRLTSVLREDGYIQPCRTVPVELPDVPAGRLRRHTVAHPFVPGDPARRAERCRDIFAMQVAGLAQKLTGAGKSRLVLGVSGGLDSTLALLVAAKTMDFLGLPRTNVSTFSLPGFGTTRRTHGNAGKVCRALGVSYDIVNIRRACRRHLADLGHAGEQDIVFENVQARYRTEFLFNKANQLDALMLGTGDLTEAALGWSTFAGDHLSHYHVNASIPKTLVRYLVRWAADDEFAGARSALYDILATPISPELLRPVSGEISQKSEETIGPVELADFFLYPFIRFGTRPGKILFLADQSRQQGMFEASYSLDDIYRWLKSFLTRFFANQFKRTCFPEGPKIGTVSLSPRGDWRMPSDARPELWLADLEAMYDKLK